MCAQISPKLLSMRADSTIRPSFSAVCGSARTSCAPIGKRERIASPSCPPPHSVDGAKTCR